MNSHLHHVSVTLLTLITFLLLVINRNYAQDIEATYQNHKAVLLSKYTDRHGLVIELNNGQPDGIGDSGFRTGLAALCMALERDQENTRKYLTALHDKCWLGGKPIRHPDSKETGSKTYSRDQFIPQMVACFYAHEYGDAQTKELAKKLYKRFIDRIRNDNGWRLNEGGAATIDLGNRFAFFEVADRLGLVEGPKLKNAGGREPRMAFIYAMKTKTPELKVSGDNPRDFYGVHLMFLEALVTIKCRPQTNDLISTAHGVADEAGKHNMGPFIWLRGDVDRAKSLLTNWPKKWDKIDYVWQRNKAQQSKDSTAPSDKHEYPRLDFMLLTRLLKEDIRRQ